MYLYDLLVQTGLALVVGSILGLISFIWGQRNGGIRVFVIISVGCCLTAYLSINLGVIIEQPWMADPARIAAQLVSAVGFLVAGIIWYQDNQARGLSSAALLWVTAILGLMIGSGYYTHAMIALFAVIMVILVGELHYRWN